MTPSTLELEANSAGQQLLEGMEPEFPSTTERGEQILRTLNSLFDALSELDSDSNDSHV